MLYRFDQETTTLLTEEQTDGRKDIQTNGRETIIWCREYVCKHIQSTVTNKKLRLGHNCANGGTNRHIQTDGKTDVQTDGPGGFTRHILCGSKYVCKSNTMTNNTYMTNGWAYRQTGGRTWNEYSTHHLDVMNIICKSISKSDDKLQDMTRTHIC
jgi:hypothetical protein